MAAAAGVTRQFVEEAIEDLRPDLTGDEKLELLIETPFNHEDRARKQGSFYAEVVRFGVRLA